MLSDHWITDFNQGVIDKQGSIPLHSILKDAMRYPRVLDSFEYV